MRFPDETTSHANLSIAGRYAGARVRADPEAKDLAPLIQAPHDKLTAAVGGRNTAEDALTDAQARRDFEWARFSWSVHDLGRHALAHFRSRDDEGFLRLFPRPPSEIAATPERDRKRVVPALVAAATSKKTPAPLAPQAKAVADGWKRVEDATAEVRAAEATLAAAREVEAKARTAWFIGYRRLHAQLTDRFPHDRKRVDGYFRGTTLPKTKRVRLLPDAAPRANGADKSVGVPT